MKRKAAMFHGKRSINSKVIQNSIGLGGMFSFTQKYNIHNTRHAMLLPRHARPLQEGQVAVFAGMCQSSKTDLKTLRDDRDLLKMFIRTKYLSTFQVTKI